MDESGVSQKPPVHSTWAPKGRTPLIEHNFSWKKLSVATFLSYRTDNRRHELFFQVNPGSYAGEEIIELLEAFKKQTGARRCVLIWDQLPAHKSARVRKHLEGEKNWLRVEWLPGYAPELNPVEQVWSNIKGKGGELANLCARDLKQTHAALCAGIKRVARTGLPKSFLKHAGLSL